MAEAAVFQSDECISDAELSDDESSDLDSDASDEKFVQEQVVFVEEGMEIMEQVLVPTEVQSNNNMIFVVTCIQLYNIM